MSDKKITQLPVLLQANVSPGTDVFPVVSASDGITKQVTIGAAVAAATAGITAGVSTVNGRSGTVTLTSTDVGLANVNNTSDANKPVSTATTAALAAKEPAQTPATQAEMVAGTEVNIRSMSPLRVAQAVAALAATGGLGRKLVTGADTLVAADTAKVVACTNAIAADFTVTMSAPASLAANWYVIVRNDSAYLGTFTCTSIDGGTSKILYPGDVYIFQCNATDVKTTRLDGVAQFGSLGTAVVTEAISPGNSVVASCALSTTRSIGFYCNAAGHPKAVLMDQNGTVVNATVIEAVATSGMTPDIIPLTSTTALLIYGLPSAGGGVRAVVLTDSGATITVGTIVSVEIVNTGKMALAFLTSTKAIAMWQDNSTNRTRAACLSVSGTTISVGTIITADATEATNGLRGASLSSTQAAFMYAQSSSQANIILVTEAATVLTVPASSLAFAGGAVTSTNEADICPVSATRFAYVFGNGGGVGVVGLIDVTGTGTSARSQVGPATPLPNTSTFSHHRIKKLSTGTLVLQSTSMTGNGLVIRSLTIRGDNLIVGDGKNVARQSSGHDLCIASGSTSVLSFYIDNLVNSSFPTARPISLGTVT